MLKKHLIVDDGWKAVYRMYRQATLESSNSKTRRTFQPRAASDDPSLTIEEVLGYRFVDPRLMETAVTHSCASR
jgi:hypothetical protein